jgi:hypothetical protein
MPGEPLPGESGLPTAELELESGREALEASDVQRAATHLGLVLRLAPSLAPAVLDLIADRSEPPLALVRGDAYRLVGQEYEARRAFAEAAREPDPFGWIGGSRAPTPRPDETDAAGGTSPETGTSPANGTTSEDGTTRETDTATEALGPTDTSPPDEAHPEGDPA